MTDVAELTVACPDRDTALGIADALLEARLAACCNLGGEIASRYWWKGSLESASEWLLAAKIRADLFDAAVAVIRSRHPYETPAITAHRLDFVDAATRAWIAEATKA